MTADRLSPGLFRAGANDVRPNPSAARESAARRAETAGAAFRAAPRPPLGTRAGALRSARVHHLPERLGLQDDFVGTCHGVMKRIAPEAQIIDITHGIPPQAVLEGARSREHRRLHARRRPSRHRRPWSGRASPRARPSRHRGQGLRRPRQRPAPARRERTGIAEAHELANPAYALETISRTFHGRDLVRNPAAAHLARGVPVAELGLDPEGLIGLDLQASARRWSGGRDAALCRQLWQHRAERDEDDIERIDRLRAPASSSSSPGSATTRSWRGRSRTPVQAM